MSSTLHTPRFESSKQWVPPALRDTDTSNFRYIPNLTDEMRDHIIALEMDEVFQDRIRPFLPKKDQPSNTDFQGLLELLGNMNDVESRAGSRFVDTYLSEEIGEGVLILNTDANTIDLERLKVKGEIHEVMYESMPTQVYYETLGGFSLAVINIKDGDPETVEVDHVHNGGRLVIALSPESKLELPGKIVELKRGDAVWMPPMTLHSFQAGEFLALHPSEAGFDHPEAFVPMYE